MSEKIPTKNEEPIPCKLILVGESGVGKTSIISCYLSKHQEKIESTLGAYFSNKLVIIDGYKIKFEIWDTAGQEQYRSINALFYKDACICLMVYDITDKRTFDCLRDYWYESVSENGLQGVIFGVAGNKNDLFEEEEVDENEVKEFCKSINACFQLTSAQSYSSIDEIFRRLGEKFISSDFMKELIPKYVNNKNITKNEDEDNLKQIDNIKITKETVLIRDIKADESRSKCC
jgi:small GTP-binding protein